MSARRERGPWTGWYLAAARRKTSDQLSKARTATQIAEKGLRAAAPIARPGMHEDELAVELKWYMKTLGAEDNFLMLCAGSHNPAVQPSSGRRLEAGDIILAEITPSYMGQMAQICRTAVIGPANESLKRCYELVVRSMKQGIAASGGGRNHGRRLSRDRFGSRGQRVW